MLAYSSKIIQFLERVGLLVRVIAQNDVCEWL